MTGVIYLEVIKLGENAHKVKCGIPVSGMLKYLGVFRSGYHAWLKRIHSNTV